MAAVQQHDQFSCLDSIQLHSEFADANGRAEQLVDVITKVHEEGKTAQWRLGQILRSARLLVGQIGAQKTTDVLLERTQGNLLLRLVADDP